MNEQAISILQDYISGYLFLPAGNWPDYWFRYRSYARETACEILAILQTNETDYNEVLEKYIKEINRFSTIKDDGVASIILDAALETAEDILFIIEKEYNNESIKKIGN